MLPAERGADIAATSGDGAAQAPPGAGPRRVRAEHALGAAWFFGSRTGAPMRRGPLALGALTASAFGLFLVPKGRPRRLFPGPEDPAAEGEEDGSMEQGNLSLVLE
jgi:hypothetical protein